ncbi:MAG: cysteine--tRNA ligase [Candidatus Eisenbacteria bacterium]|nr:cysteine--tRNA ligase [Candidatus Latescibacterota bacterium]MBD3302597.1 cysteine--tRNA ligase [Candidatus Eisenbacteria bacterium]
MSLRVLDNLSREKRDFVPVQTGQVGMYVCGMTVQDRPHVGHMRAAVVGDLIRRTLLRRGYRVTYVNNFTDVEDKILARAKEEGCDYLQVAQRNMTCYLEFVDKLNILRADHYPRATEHIPEIQDLVQRLIQQDFAYPSGGDVYFRVERFPRYGKLSGRKIDELRSGARIEVGENKDNPLDFTLWKGAREGEPSWPSPWGPGRPGWHIECSAMSMKYLGENFDFHGGGLDLIFPHHENEIAQSECATGKAFANFWVHNGLVMLGGEKMSKSTKHFFLIEDVCQKIDPRVVRFYLLSTHFRSPIEFSEIRLAEADQALARLLGAVQAANERLGPTLPRDGLDPVTPEEAGSEEARRTIDAFNEALDDDFNSAKGLGHLFELARAMNRWAGERETPEFRTALEGGRRVLVDLAGWLGIDLLAPSEVCEVPEAVEELVRQRTRARAERNWAEADRLRNVIQEAGYSLEDRDDQTIVRPLR